MKNYTKLSQNKLNKEFIDACENGHLEVVKYLLTSPELKKHVNIHVFNDYGFRFACVNGHLNIVQYLLTSPDLKNHANIHSQNDLGFQWACGKGHIKIVQYLLTSVDLKDHANIHADDDYGFKYVCSNGQLELIKYFIFDMAIKKTKAIIKYLNEHPDEQIEKMFNIRELNDKLDKNLSSDKIDIYKKMKL
jgi:ankyrin repeat protein